MHFIMYATSNNLNLGNEGGYIFVSGKLIPLAYGIKKLQIIATIEDDKVYLSLYTSISKHLFKQFYLTPLDFIIPS